MRQFNLHLVSDSTGETVCSVARAAIAQFPDVDPEEHVWSLVRTKGQVEKVLESIEMDPGPVMYTVVQKDLRDMLKEGCARLKVPCIPVLTRVIMDLSAYLNIETAPRPGRQHELDEDYFSRVEAINFALSHDDGQANWDLDDADILLIGASRTSKSPTCIYLAYRGFRAANIPFVPGCPIPDNVFELKNTMVVGLTISPDRLAQIRKNRLLALNQNSETDYVDIDRIKEELVEARKLFSKHRWPVIDVSRRSVEETSATIIQHYQEYKSKMRHR